MNIVLQKRTPLVLKLIQSLHYVPAYLLSLSFSWEHLWVLPYCAGSRGRDRAGSEWMTGQWPREQRPGRGRQELEEWRAHKKKRGRVKGRDGRGRGEGAKWKARRANGGWGCTCATERGREEMKDRKHDWHLLHQRQTVLNDSTDPGH